MFLTRQLRDGENPLVSTLDTELVTARKDDAPAADHAAITSVPGVLAVSIGSGLIQTTSGQG